jgi:hypothetical protein
MYALLTPPGGVIELVAVGALTHILDRTSVAGILSYNKPLIALGVVRITDEL